MADGQSSDQQSTIDRMVGLISGWFVSRALHVAAELGIADLLSDGPKSVSALSAATEAHPQSLYRLLRMLASYGIFAETSDGLFELTPAGALLQSGALRDYASFISDAEWNGYGALLHNIRTVEPAFKHVNGSGFFDYLSAHPEAQQRFDRGMANAADAENPVIAKAYDFSNYKRIVDVGGGRGGFLAEVLRTHPAPRGVLYDQPQVVLHPDYLTKAGVIDRCDLMAGNFFESVPSDGDLYILKRIMHDWPDDICAGILRRCRDAVAKNGRVVVVDAVVPSGNQPHLSKTIDILMMVLFDGRERTESEFRDLFARSGLKLTRVVPTPATLSIVEGVPV
jgi:O-methyltransferase domain/Dimerisation domain